MEQMYQRNDDPALLNVQQAFTNVQYNDIIKVMPYCELCIKASQPDSGVEPAQCQENVWFHQVRMIVESGAMITTVLCTKGG